ncbi:GNAT family N-acetyltransferase [Microbacterium sp. No. 7]|uniref:GNAT family N-acetyltransferase n=1 Tax=Microbacterium sp. No. 7 TaxID=1714373 RepID=UPI0006D20A63|nr:GNAT family N-acetyltransferase [Microbacterium sp. No. 7]ALJ19767.1 acetyltransferase [Microbacterium sp. No. 7]
MNDLARSHHDAPLDDLSLAAVAGQGLALRRVDDADAAQVAAWLDAVSRGFLDGERNETQHRAFFDLLGYRRKLGVYDEDAPHPETPSATFASWAAELTVPGGTVPTCAITSVTVAPTHRRRGLLRSLMTGELRTAASLGLPVATLTVSESGIYGRFGFGPAAHATSWTIASRRATWTGPIAPGRVDFVSREHARTLVEALHERIRRTSPGEVDMPGGHWDRFLGTRPDAEKADQRRVLQYRSPAGEVDGLVLYSVTENEHDYSESTLDVALLMAATDEAYAGLWRFLLSMDLIGTVRAGELSTDEPLWWMIADQRAARIAVRDHHYVRILDVPAALRARRFGAPGLVALEVADALGLAEGRWLLRADADGTGHVTAWEGAAPAGAITARLGVAELSAAYLGGVSLATLARAGRVETTDADALARVFGWSRAPRLSYWY